MMTPKVVANVPPTGVGGVHGPSATREYIDAHAGKWVEIECPDRKAASSKQYYYAHTLQGYEATTRGNVLYVRKVAA